MAEETQDGQKTIIAFIVGLLVGGLIVWAFSVEPMRTDGDKAPKDAENATTTEEMSTTTSESTVEGEESKATSLPVGDGSIKVGSQKAGYRVALDGAVYPIGEGWIGVRDYNDEKLGSILGVVRFSQEQRLIPSEIILQTPTKAGNTYAVMIFSENGDREFSSATDVQTPTVFATFTVN